MTNLLTSTTLDTLQASAHNFFGRGTLPKKLQLVGSVPPLFSSGHLSFLTPLCNCNYLVLHNLSHIFGQSVVESTLSFNFILAEGTVSYVMNFTLLDGVMSGVLFRGEHCPRKIKGTAFNQ
jgi:hypothetical protein